MELKTLVEKHVTPRPSSSTEKGKFYHDSQRRNEMVNKSAAALKHTTERCQFDTFLDEALKDRFVCGLKLPLSRRN